MVVCRNIAIANLSCIYGIRYEYIRISWPIIYFTYKENSNKIDNAKLLCVWKKRCETLRISEINVLLNILLVFT